MKNDSYWKNRAAWDMYHRMEDAEETADLIVKVYRNVSMLLTNKAKDIFEKYMTKYGLSETQAWNLLNTLQDQTSLEELMNALKNKDSDKTKQQLLQELEAPAYRARMERLKDLLQQVDTIMQETYQQEQLFDTSFFRNLCEDVYYRSIYNVQKQTGLRFSFSNISKKQVEQVLYMNWSGRHYSQRIWKNTQDLSKTLKQELLVSLLTGRTDRETSEVIMNRCGAGAMQARRLVRTESCFLSGELTARSYEECGIEKYRYLATLDLRTSEICRSLDGKIFFLKDRKVGKNYPPMHPWCRSTTVSVINEDILKNMKRSAYNPKTGHIETVPATMTYEKWYEKYVKGDAKAEAEEKSVKNKHSDREQYDRYKELLGKDVPKSFADFQEMKYNEPEKWELLRTYARSVDKGTISPLSGFENYQKIYDEINEKVVGIKTSEGTAVTRQSKHFMDRVIGTMKDPKTGRSRSGVTVEGIRDALENPAKVFPTRTDPDSRKSQKYIGRHGTVSLDPETGILIQCNPTDADYVRRIANGNAKI